MSPAPQRDRSWRVEIAILAALTVMAAAVRVWRLDTVPPGLHGDEALTGIEAARILRDGWIGPYTYSTLGWPAGHLYWAAAVVRALGLSVFSIRFSMALCGIVAVPLAWAAFRPMFGRRVALIVAAWLSVSLWSVHYSRTGFNVAPWLPLELAAIGLLFAAMRGRTWLFAALGVVLGAGIYSYALFPWSAALLGAFAAGWLVLDRSARTWRNTLGLAGSAVIALVVMAPLITFALDPDEHFFSKYQRYQGLSLFDSPELRSAAPLRQAEMVVGSLGRFGRALFVEGRPDFVDGAGLTPMIDPVTGLLVLAGAVLAWRRRRSPPYAFLLFFAVTLPLPAAFNSAGHYRGSFGVAPVLAVLAALPVCELLSRGRRAGRAAAAVLGVCIAAWNLYAYFGVFAPSGHARWVYAGDLRRAISLVESLPGRRPYVYFLSSRWSWNYEPRLLLGPTLAGEDRSREFGRLDLSAPERPAIFLLFPPYDHQLAELRRLHPGGRAYRIRAPQGGLRFVAYRVSRSAAEGDAAALPAASGAPRAPRSSKRKRRMSRAIRKASG